MQRVEVDGTLWGHLVEGLSVLLHDGLTDPLLQTNGRSPHQGQPTEVDQTTVCQDVGLFRHLIGWRGVGICISYGIMCILVEVHVHKLKFFGGGVGREDFMYTLSVKKLVLKKM